ncbi:hypothetical protein OV207_02685 [Corallococcus sp. BB11-1]|uniref:hypothetical protein n=1 Tax=Corallococcus sp. BB11-1 TaxID=2996783 RepID=UPI00227200F7|nr:hypothetical protein [Corallococcus sp. BB11-1]MCY1030348.1 hypothetical protein [Corallococcus sp. BB11-1]
MIPHGFRALCLGLLGLGLGGCSLLGYHKLPPTPRASPEEAAQVRFPDAFDDATHLPGPMLEALTLALNDFLPPGRKVQTNARDQRIAECLSRRGTYETRVLRSQEGLFFVSFIPDLTRCGLDAEILDGGAVYCIDGRGRILAVR